MHKRPDEISGGMKQRVGIARALAMEPEVLLLDEPFGALDALTRAHLQDSVMEIQADLNNTMMMVTHDVDEAVLLSDRIVMMTNGPAATVGEILDVNLDRPRNRVEMSELPEYNHCRHDVLSFLYERHGKKDESSEAKKPKAVSEETSTDAAKNVIDLETKREEATKEVA
jgi:nitrate/nitrite transport system ATP-binding protein